VFALLTQDPAPINYAKPPENDAFGQLTKLASTFNHVDELFYFTYAVCIFFFVLIVGVLLVSVVKYHRKTYDQPAASNVTHNTPLEVVWTVIPLIIVMVMFAWGFDGCMDMTYAPHEASRNQYKATAKQWNWAFSYPNDQAQSFNEVWLVKDKPVQFVLESTDVLHAFYIPSMRVKRDIIPGRLQTLWFTPTETGDFHLFCAEYCGQDHSRMYAKVHVVTQTEYDRRPWDERDPNNLPKNGESLYKQICASCHTVNGTASVGPSWKGLFTKQGDTYVGRKREVIEGGQKKEITVDDAYITESILKPDQKKVAEEPYVKNAMTAFPTLSEVRIQDLIAYMKSLADAK
jgi:cytochrome c oxidase subunit 2